MSRTTIKINPGMLESKISKLKVLHSECEANTNSKIHTNGSGNTNIAMSDLNIYLLTLNVALGTLIQSTITLLENAKDGYINTDEKTATLIKKLQGEVFH